MERKKSKNSDQYEYFCEWEGCLTYLFTDLTEFFTHLKVHCQEVKKISQDYIICDWKDCKEEFSSSKINDFYAHLSYHGYHSKLMSYGAVEIEKVSLQIKKKIRCYIDSSARTILPVLPDSFVCGWRNCFSEFIEAESFYRHVEKHPFEDVKIPSMSKDQLKKCKFACCLWNDCNFKTNSRFHLKDHLKSHTQEKVIACPNCGSMFCSKIKLGDHILRQYLNESFTTEHLQTLLLHVSGPNEEQQLTLTLIPQVSEDTSNEIISNIPSKNQTVFSTALGRFKCNYCEKICATKSLLREHSKSHFESYIYKCKLCSFKSPSPSGLLHHKKYRHNNERPFLCQFCDAKFKSKSDLRKHIDIHSSEHPFKCSLCLFTCRCCHTLNRHIKLEHENCKQIYECHQCKKQFTRGNNLSRHLISVHSLKVPEGKTRFIYKPDDDGIFRCVLNF